MRMKTGDLVAVAGCTAYPTLNDAKRALDARLVETIMPDGSRVLGADTCHSFSVHETLGVFMSAAEFKHTSTRMRALYGGGGEQLMTYACVFVLLPTPSIAWVQAKFVGMRFIP